MSFDVSAASYRLLMTTDTVGGVWRYCIDAARALSEAGVTIALVTLGPRPSPEQRSEAAAIGRLELIETDAPLDWLCERRREAVTGANSIAVVARDFRADVVQLNGTAFAGEADFGAPVLAAQHSCVATWWSAVKGGPLPTHESWRFDLMRGHLRSAESVSAPTQAFARQTAKVYGLVEAPRVICNGRVWPKSSGGCSPIDAIMTAGRLWDEGKNIATVERAARRISAPVFAAGPTCGPHGARVSLGSLRAAGALSESEIRARLAERPIFVATPLYEPFGLGVLEAAQAGCALILSDIETLRELWDGAAVFVPATDDERLADAMTRLLHDARTRNAFASAARERAARYSIHQTGAALLEWHRETLARRGGWESAA